jgi:CDP-diacylglycerol--serine O-phosphatidyltransferase
MAKTYWTIANFFSLCNILCGTLSVFCAVSRSFAPSAGLMLGGVLCDFLDGKTARHFSQTTFFGKGLDSLSDMVSFGLAPAVFGFSFMNLSVWWIFLIFVLFVFAGAWRLAYYMQWSGKGRPPGMPITVNGIAFPIAFFLHIQPAFFPLLYFFSILLMVGPILISRYPIS